LLAAYHRADLHKTVRHFFRWFFFCQCGVIVSVIVAAATPGTEDASEVILL
jgi:hypothetical protein